MTRFPAEFAPHRLILLIWPHPTMDWQHDFAAVSTCYRDLYHAISQVTPVGIIVQDEAHQEEVAAQLPSASPTRAPHFFTIRTNDTWVRDTGPISVFREEKLQLLDFQFNGWGKKFPAEKDNALNQQLHQDPLLNETPITKVSLFVEGGNLETDGQGTLLTTKQCWQCRHPELSMDAISCHMKELLGIRRILWLQSAELQGDDTDSHIDVFARFLSPDTIAYIQPTTSKHPNFHTLTEMERELHAFTQLNKKPYQLCPLPLPALQHGKQGQPLPMSYANFLMTNQSIIFPFYGCDEDQLALARLTKACPQYQVIPVNARPLVEQGGSIHCATLPLYA